MLFLPKPLVHISFLLCFTFSGISQDLKKEHSQLYESGQLQKLKKEVKDDNSMNGYFLKGLIAKEEGDIDFAYINWKKSNSLRIKKYGKHSPWRAWNYALISNYHYEKMNIKEAVRSANAALKILNELNDQKKLEIRAYHIYLLLGQSIKSDGFTVDNLERINKVYGKALDIYSSALTLIEKYDIPRYYKAKAYHLIGNCHTDFTLFYSLAKGNKTLSEQHFKEAERSYNKAENVYLNTYGKVHPGLGTVYFVHGLLWKYRAIERTPLCINTQKRYYKLALSSYGIRNNSFKNLVDYSGALMTYRYLNEVLLYEAIRDMKITEYEKVELGRYLKGATALWHKIQKDFQSSNKNLNLALYQLNPYRDVMEFETKKIKLGKKPNLSSLHSAGHYLKYSDINNSIKSGKFKSIVSVQCELCNAPQY